jgi:hypothetical protein
MAERVLELPDVCRRWPPGTDCGVTDARRFPKGVERLITRLPEPARPHVRESLSRLGSVRRPGQALQAFSDEVEHLLRVLMPVFVRHPMVRTPAAARRLAALSAASAATVEQAEELLAAVSLGSAVPPGAATVLAVAVAATVLESYAAASVRVHQLRYYGVEIDPDAIARDVHAALFDEPQRSDRRYSARRLARRGATRIGRRWAAGLVPVAGIVYAAHDARRTIDRVLLRPVPH